MGVSQNLSLVEAMRAEMRVHLSLIPLATLVSPLLCQLKFNGGVSSSSSNSNSNSPSANRNTNNNNRPTDVDEKFFFGGDTPSLTGNQALDGGIVGLGLGALGAAVLARPYKVLSMGASRARATPVEGERGKQILVEAKHQEEEGIRSLMVRRGFSCPRGKAAPATPMEGGGGKLLARMSLEPGSLAGSLVGNNPIVAAAATTASPSTTMGSTVTSRTKASTTKTRDSTTRTRDSTARTRGSTTKTTGDASATTV